MSQMMQLPSDDADTNSESLPRTRMQLTVALCSFMDPSITRLSAVTRHTRTDPSNPPLTILSASVPHAIAVTPPTCASLITYSSFPDCGPNALILPSDQPESMARPSREKATQKQSRLGICTRSSSAHVRLFQTRMSSRLHVAKSSEYPAGKTTSCMRAEWHVDRSSAARESHRTRYVAHAAVAAKKSWPDTCGARAVTAAPPSMVTERSTLRVSGCMTETDPSPAPTRRRPSGARSMQTTPWLSLALGPRCLNTRFRTLTRSTSPVAVPA
mmetsp:Transcript_35252/g.73828  ORF Transcript_35252/g.73828 Transcript_35252/m.73828 type:complete len:271 (-) Transcript_35252:629-1441(-)